MRVAGIAVTALLVLAAAQAAATALAIALLVAIIYGTVAHPRETFGLLGLCIVAGLIERFPLQCLGLAALVTVAGMVRRS